MSTGTISDERTLLVKGKNPLLAGAILSCVIAGKAAPTPTSIVYSYKSVQESYQLDRSTNCGSPTEENGPGGSADDPAEALHEIRDRSGLTWKQIAAIVRVEPRTLHNWINGTGLSEGNMRRLSCLRITLKKLLDGQRTENRFRLVTTREELNGRSIYDLLVDQHFDDAARQIEVANSYAVRRQRTSLTISEEEWAKRKGPSAFEMMDGEESPPPLPFSGRIPPPVKPK